MRRIVYWIPFTVYSAVLVYLLLSPSAQLPEYLLEQSDKILHLISFAGLKFFYLTAVSRFYQKSDLNTSILIHGFLLLSISGGIIEVLQSVVPGRNASLSDFLFNNIGLVSGLLVFILFRYVLIVLKNWDFF
ncbi:MAG: VanZ family protein [Thermaurantimonas aggregans]|uniref:VanZ family protein n=1 Tax=Thermaurantimonas aggregans TaxID=2173829 RepID=UPI000F55D38B|nr:VanZ family protein [Thermaurantimonas aggregans]MCX8148104.1 VanZ family protein [Thermaurantimonas aggregans]